nr:immunoglobulin light chain junction region [Macaca mulatta]MOW60791.1 immunoglobulin light chain junction region [Macaca mulatta]MOW61034.1 immunoglobulin light chain junction region [Macaca mulatta]
DYYCTVYMGRGIYVF